MRVLNSRRYTRRDVDEAKRYVVDITVPEVPNVCNLVNAKPLWPNARMASDAEGIVADEKTDEGCCDDNTDEGCCGQHRRRKQSQERVSSATSEWSQQGRPVPRCSFGVQMAQQAMSVNEKRGHRGSVDGVSSCASLGHDAV